MYKLIADNIDRLDRETRTMNVKTKGSSLLVIVDDCWWLKYYSLKLIYCKNNVFVNRFADIFAEAFMGEMLGVIESYWKF